MQTDLKDVANIMREREGAEEGDLYLYEGDELTAENEFDKKGISKKQAKAYHDADNSDIAINVDKTDLTKGAELYGTITEEAVHAGQKARGEVYDSEDGIGGRSEGLAEFANKTASSAWDLENKIAGISNESNSLQMDNWRTDNSSSETMLIGLGKAENAQDVQPDIYLFGNDNLRIPFPGEDMDLHFGVQESYVSLTRNVGSDTNLRSKFSINSTPSVGASVYGYFVLRNKNAVKSINYGIKNGLTIDNYFIENNKVVGVGGSAGIFVPTPWNFKVNTNMPIDNEIEKILDNR